MKVGTSSDFIFIWIYLFILSIVKVTKYIQNKCKCFLHLLYIYI